MLREIFDKNYCDKGTRHSYELIYEKDFEAIRHEHLTILEIGIFKGQSIAAWLEYFPNSTIYGIDVFTRINPAEIEILNNSRVKFIKADSTNSSIISLIEKNWPGVKFDIIIDDGLHTPLGNKNTFENLIHFLKNSGLYYIEDVWPVNEMLNTRKKNSWINNRKLEFSKENIELFLSSLKKYNVDIFDNRKISKQPDSIIYKITK